MEGVLVNNFLGDSMKLEFHIFGIWEVIVQVEIFDVSDETFSSRCINDTVETEFCGGDGGRWSN